VSNQPRETGGFETHRKSDIRDKETRQRNRIIGVAAVKNLAFKPLKTSVGPGWDQLVASDRTQEYLQITPVKIGGKIEQHRERKDGKVCRC
jgi:hypothetical protein